MKRNIFLFFITQLFAAFLMPNGLGQKFIPEEVMQFRSPYLKNLQAVGYTSSGTFIVAGMFEDEMAVKNVNVLSGGYASLFIAAFDTLGECSWMNSLECTGYAGITNLHITGKQDIVIIGWFTDSLKIGNQSYTGITGSQVFCIEIDNGGTIRNVSILLKEFSGRVKTFFCDTLGQITLGGFFNRPFMLEETLVVPKGKQDGLVIKFDKSKKVVKTIMVSGTGLVSVDGVLRNKEYTSVAGTFSRKLTLGDTTLHSKGRKDIFSFRLNEKLEVDRMQSFGSVKNDDINDYATDKKGNIYLTGSVNGPVLSVPIEGSYSGGSDVYLMKLDPLHRMDWLKIWGSKYKDQGLSVETDGSNRLFFSGVYKKRIIFDGDTLESPHRYPGGFLTCLTQDGGLLWTHNFKSNSEMYPALLGSDKQDHMVVAGAFQDQLSVKDLNLQSLMNPDGFLINYLDPCSLLHFNLPGKAFICKDGQDTLDAGPGYSSYLWNDGLADSQSIVINEPGQYRVRIIDSYGCQASDTIHVQLDSLIATYEVSPEIMPEGGNGTLRVIVLSGIPPYRVTWDDGFSGPYRENLFGGFYFFEVKDSIGCIYNEEVFVDQLQGTGILDLQAFPNPMNEFTRIVFSLPDNTWMELAVFDNAGRKIQIIFSGNYRKGSHTLQWHAEQLKPGIYTIRLSTMKNAVNKNILIRK